MHSAVRGITAVLAAGAAMLMADAGPAHAVTGGDVIRHDSIQNLVIAKDIRNYNAGYGSNCSIWNWGGGNTWNWVQGGGNCRTSSMNGRTYSWTVWNDTDAFTLQYEAYWLNMHGSWRRVNANVYTKIQDHENAHCYRESDGVNCYVSYG
ncbi:hypothetical protein [Streptomyces sp. NPDC012510]|uniref:hypothetical protein n=1 Tax=Streptomyces sp. NPDC012510 TaxID=3364838 RepID=UPI0036EC5808